MHQTPLGEIVIGRSSKGLCWLGFMIGGYKGDGFSRMQAYFPQSKLVRDEAQTKDLMQEIMTAWKSDRLRDIALDLRGTDFQCAVWKALLNIPRGEVKSYGAVANDVGRPKAFRAVGSAVGENPVSLIIPCHRVVQASGALGNYGWGVDLKKKILRLEGYRF